MFGTAFEAYDAQTCGQFSAADIFVCGCAIPNSINILKIREVN